MKTLILDTPTCKIYNTKEGVVLQMKMESGDWIQQKPFTGDLKGLIAALTLSIDVIAGKIWLEKVVVENKENDFKLLK